MEADEHAAAGLPRGWVRAEDAVPYERHFADPVAGLAERVAALEMAADIAAIPSSWQSLTEAEQEGFIAAIAESRQHVRYRILNAPLTPDEVRQLVRECVTTVGPGETLVIRGRDWTPGQVREVQDWMDADHASGRIDFRVLAVIGDELAVVKPEASDGT